MMDSSDAITWRRGSPIAIVAMFVKNLYHLFQAWPAFAGFVAFPSLREVFLPYGLSLLLVAMVVVAVLQYLSFFFAYDDEQVNIKSGILSKQRITLNYDRIQEINLEQPIYFRPFDIWSLKLDSAGSTTTEISIAGLRRDWATDIQARFKRVRNAATLSSSEIPPPSAPDEKEEGEAILKLGTGEVVRAGLIDNSLVYLIAIASPLLFQNDALLNSVTNWLETLPLTVWLTELDNTQSRMTSLVFIFLLIIAVTVLIYLASVLFAISKFWNYVLSFDGQRLQYKSGLFKRVTRGFKLQKLQRIRVRRSLIARLLHRYTFTMYQANDRQNINQQGIGGFVVPVVDEAVKECLLAITSVNYGAWEKTERAGFVIRAVVWSVFLCALVSAFMYQAEKSFFYLIPAVPVLCYLLSYLHWRCFAFSITGEWCVIKSGFLTQTQQLIPVSKVQKMTLRQGPLLRMCGCFELKIWTAAGSFNIPYVKAERLSNLRDQVLTAIRQHQGAWM